MATSKKDKNESKNLRTLFSVICLSIIALGLIVYFSSQGSGKTPVPIDKRCNFGYTA